MKMGTLGSHFHYDFGDPSVNMGTPSLDVEFHGLPIQELSQLKQTIFTLLPQYWRNPLEFEPTWVTCTESIGQGCKRAHQSACH